MKTEAKRRTFWSHCIKWLAIMVVLAFFGYLAAYCYTWRLHGLPMRIGSAQLRNIYEAWNKDGSPASPVITNYVLSTSDHYFIWTNRYMIAGSNFESQFGLKTSKFSDRGFLVISRDGRLAWIDKESGPELVGK